MSATDPPAYAILGATGNTGSALLTNLLARPDAPRIHAYCRNRAKLLAQHPALADTKRVQLFTGAIDDAPLLLSCMRGTRAVFLVASTNDNVPGCRIGQDLARAVVRASCALRDEGARVPRLCLLSSSSVDAHLSRHMGALFKAVMLRAAWHVYEDLRRAEALLREHEGWLRCVFVKPGGIAQDVQRGHELSLDEDQTFVSYLDVAAGMIEACDAVDGRWDARNVSVRNVPGVGTAKFPAGTPATIFFGLVRYFVPALHPYLPTGGP